MILAVFIRVGKLPTVNETLNKSASWSDISFLSSFITLVGILYGVIFPNLCFPDNQWLENQFNFFFVCWWEEKGIWVFICEVISVTFMWILYFSLCLFVDCTKVIVQNICNPFQIINSFILKSKVGVIDAELLI